MSPATVARVARKIRRELGDWMLGELGDAGLRDAIWDAHPPFQKMSDAERKEFQAAVYREIFG